MRSSSGNHSTGMRFVARNHRVVIRSRRPCVVRVLPCGTSRRQLPADLLLERVSTLSTSVRRAPVNGFDGGALFSTNGQLLDGGSQTVLQGLVSIVRRA